MKEKVTTVLHGFDLLCFLGRDGVTRSTRPRGSTRKRHPWRKGKPVVRPDEHQEHRHCRDTSHSNTMKRTSESQGPLLQMLNSHFYCSVLQKRLKMKSTPRNCRNCTLYIKGNMKRSKEQASWDTFCSSFWYTSLPIQ